MPTHLKVLSLCLFTLGLWSCAAPAEQPMPVVEPDPAPVETPVPEEEVIPDPVPESPPSHTPEDLIGLEPKEIQELLGPVSLKRWEGDAQMMQFKGSQCVMDIYFYEISPGGAFEASYLSTRTLTGADVDAGSCLTSLLPE